MRLGEVKQLSQGHKLTLGGALATALTTAHTLPDVHHPDIHFQSFRNTSRKRSSTENVPELHPFLALVINMFPLILPCNVMSFGLGEEEKETNILHSDSPIRLYSKYGGNHVLPAWDMQVQ